MERKFQMQEDVGVLEIIGRLDAANTPEFKSGFSEYLEQTNQFVLNLQGLEFIDSTGLGGIVSFLKSASEAEGDVKIAMLQAKPRMVFEITRAHKIFDIFDDLDAAVESYTLVGAGQG